MRRLSVLFLILVLIFTLITQISCKPSTQPNPAPTPEITPSLKQSSPNEPLLLGSTPSIDYTQAYLLFCHGMGADSGTFNIFVDYAVNTLNIPADHIFRTNVNPNDYSSIRAQQLASYIINISQENQSIADHSLITVGHSQGGLDLRYMIGNPNNNADMGLAANKIKAVYTIAAPHGGTFAANTGSINAALYDVSENHNFNDREELSYNRMKSTDSAQIPFVALTFRAAQPPGNDQASCRMSSTDTACTAEEFVDNGRLDRWTDGEVYWNRQIFTSKSGESPPFWGPFEGCHCANKRYSWELGQTDKLKMIIAHALSGAQVTLTANLIDIPEPSGGFGSKQGVWHEGGY